MGKYQKTFTIIFFLLLIISSFIVVYIASYFKPSEYPFSKETRSIILSIITFCYGLAPTFLILLDGPINENERISAAVSKAENQPEKARPIWDLAQITIDAYFKRNLRHINAIFWLSIVVMVAGFSVILWGLSQSLHTPDVATTAWITAGAGVVTEFIGATFILIYRSTLTQALDYAKALERINSVGMAMQILDTMSDEATSDDLKSKTKATLAELLIQNQKFTISDQQNGKME